MAEHDSVPNQVKGGREKVEKFLPRSGRAPGLSVAFSPQIKDGEAVGDRLCLSSYLDLRRGMPVRA